MNYNGSLFKTFSIHDFPGSFHNKSLPCLEPRNLGQQNYPSSCRRPHAYSLSVFRDFLTSFVRLRKEEGKFMNSPPVSPSLLRKEGKWDQERFANMIRINQLIENLQFRLEEIPVLLHLRLMKKQPIPGKYESLSEQWVDKILEKNKIINYYDQNILKQFLAGYLRLSIDSFQFRAGLPVNH